MFLKRAAALSLVVLVSSWVSGCSVFSSHNETTKDARRAFEEGRFDDAIHASDEDVNNKLDGLCFQFDRGVIAQVGGKYDASIKEFERAENTIEAFEDRGLTGGKVAEEAGSLAVNEKTIPYQGEAFEKILVPVYLARDYMLEGKFDEAMVEARKIYFQQEQVRRLYEKDLADTDKQAKDNKVDASKMGDVQSKVEYPADSLKSPESVYTITFAHYITALIAEKNGNINDAYISMKDVAKIRPDIDFVQQDLVRWCEEYGSSEDQDTYKAFKVTAPGDKDGSVTLFFDCGWAPHKKELKILLPSFNTLGAIAIPLYERTPNPAAYAKLHVGDRVFATRIMSDVDAIAFKYHKNGLATRILKQIIRTTIKMAAGEAASYGARKAGGGLAGAVAGIGVGVWNVESEQADLRAWLTLPQTFQAVRAWVPEGTYPVKVELLSAQGGVLNTLDLGSITVKPGSSRFASARSLGTHLYGAMLKEAADRPHKPGKKRAAPVKSNELLTPDAKAPANPPAQPDATPPPATTPPATNPPADPGTPTEPKADGPGMGPTAPATPDAPKPEEKPQDKPEDKKE